MFLDSVGHMTRETGDERIYSVKEFPREKYLARTTGNNF